MKYLDAMLYRQLSWVDHTPYIASAVHRVTVVASKVWETKLEVLREVHSRAVKTALDTWH